MVRVVQQRLVAPTIQGLMSQRMGDDRQGELMGLFASLTALSMFAGPVLMSSVFRAFTVSAVPAPLEFHLRMGFAASSTDIFAVVFAHNELTGDSRVSSL